MRRAAPAAFACAALLALAPGRAGAAPSASLADSIARMIPEGAVTVDILTPDYPHDIEAIAKKLDAARRGNPKFFQSWIAQHPGGPPPYDPRLGVSKAEYEHYLAASRTTHYTVRTRGRLTFERAGRARRWTMHGWGLLDALEGTVIDLDRGVVTSLRTGDLPLLGASAPETADAPLPWRWYAVWKAQHVVGDPRNKGQALAASLHMGPLGRGDSTAIYWAVRRFNRGQRIADEFLLVRFPSPRAGALLR